MSERIVSRMYVKYLVTAILRHVLTTYRPTQSIGSVAITNNDDIPHRNGIIGDELCYQDFYFSQNRFALNTDFFQFS